ncbi:MAG: tRNA (adenosine(37)-N6)-dimethylallyltransferase MiaA [Actinomycetota bacterium]|nr:tRNA (adenosine(37)-N6)-dimethylallyltransferase MiaA [Actinomycetota bacterium]
MKIIKNNFLIKDLIEKKGIRILKKKLIDTKAVVVICGPTCSGKTKAALNLALLLETDIVSADSMQAFKYMNIGTDKRDTEEFSIKQFMTDICDPDYRMTAVEFRDIARNIIKNEFFNKNKVPIIAGGSGLHIRAIIDDLMYAPEACDKIKMEIRNGIKIKGLDYFYKELKKLDNEYSLKINKNDERRIIRALAVCYGTKRKYSDYLNNWDKRKSIYNCVMIGLNTERKALYENIENRVNEMMKKGLLDEVKILYEKGYSECNSVTQAIGYKELIRYLNKEITFDESVKEIKKNTRHLAKKQLTWFKADNRINWIYVEDNLSQSELIINIINIINSKVNYEKN